VRSVKTRSKSSGLKRSLGHATACRVKRRWKAVLPLAVATTLNS